MVQGHTYGYHMHGDARLLACDLLPFVSAAPATNRAQPGSTARTTADLRDVGVARPRRSLQRCQRAGQGPCRLSPAPRLAQRLAQAPARARSRHRVARRVRHVRDRLRLKQPVGYRCTALAQGAAQPQAHSVCAATTALPGAPAKATRACDLRIRRSAGVCFAVRQSVLMRSTFVRRSEHTPHAMAEALPNASAVRPVPVAAWGPVKTPRSGLPLQSTNRKASCTQCEWLGVHASQKAWRRPASVRATSAGIACPASAAYAPREPGGAVP